MSTLLLGTRKGLLTFARQGSTWGLSGEHFVGVAVPYAIRDARHDTWWASLDHGHWGSKLQRSRDGGQTWTEITAPKYPEGAEVKPGKPAAVKYLWVIQPSLASEPQTLYVGSEPGGLFVSGDGGDTWELNQALWNHPSRADSWFGGGRDEPGIHSIFVDPRNPRRVLVGISCAGVFETIDAGTSWQPRNRGLLAEYMPNPHAEVGHDAHFMMACAAAPDTLWQQNHCGIFRTTDGGQNWAAVSRKGDTAHFGFVVAVDPQDGQTAWVIPATADEKRIAVERAMCVCRTTDGGATWQRFSSGLPQENCYDFAFRHALDQSGDTLVFGTNTGALYFSDDRGETWQTIASRLPPIYSVRFA